MIKFVKGNAVDALLSGNIDYLVNQVNAKGVYGSGIAKEIGTKIPEAKKAYHTRIDNFVNTLKMEPPLGLVWHTSFVPNNIHTSKVIHLLGQNDYGTRQRQTNYGAVAKGFMSLHKIPYEKSTNEYVLGIPHGFGCGLGGGDWEVVLELIEHCLAPYWKEVHIYEL